MKILNLRNLYGYPSYTESIREYAKSIKAQFIVDRVALLEMTKEDRLSERPKILIDAFTVFVHDEIPVLGYRVVNGFYLKDSRFPHRDQLERNLCKIKIQSNLRRVSPKLLIQALEAPIKKDFLDQLDPKSDDYKVIKALFSPFLPPTLNDPFTKIKTSAGSRVQNKKDREAKLKEEK